MPDTHGPGDPSDRHSRHARGRRRKYKVVIHTSPFLRCVQTSIAVAAGMDQHEGGLGYNSPTASYIMHSGSPILRARDHQHGTPNLSAIPEPEENGVRKPGKLAPSSTTDSRPVLRVDAFLGEWLSPDYFENITPPPSSKMMIASAKADLLRRGDPIENLTASTGSPTRQGNFPGGWKGGALERNDASTPGDEGTLGSLPSIGQHLPKISRSNTFNPGSRANLRMGRETATKAVERSTHYTPPTPPYAILPTQAIPQGYVAHARDACLNVDYQWDSLRPPLEWGSGGEYGEEWSSMHKRFRRGLHEILSWYRDHDISQRPEEISGQISASAKTDSTAVEVAETPCETILILITHGAGCNALIGALTNQPVLIDVGMASLTMAERKNIDYTKLDFHDSPSLLPTPRRRSSTEDSEEYEMKIIASSDHLRPGSRLLQEGQRGRSPSMPNREKSPYRYERHVLGQHHQHHAHSSPLQDTHSVDSDELGGSSSSSPIRHGAPTALSSSTGLWTPPKPKSVEENEEIPKSEKPSLRGGASNDRNGTSKVRPKSLHIPEPSTVSETPKTIQSGSPTGRSLAQAGLWGAPPQALATEREKGAKRRWTLSQAG